MRTTTTIISGTAVRRLLHSLGYGSFTPAGRLTIEVPSERKAAAEYNYITIAPVGRAYVITYEYRADI